MATSPAITSATIHEFSLPAAAPLPARSSGVTRRRKITPEAGRALEILGHAIEYLTDEFVHAGGSFSSRDPQVEAVQLLMSLNRKIYFECPEAPSFADRLRTLMRVRPA